MLLPDTDLLARMVDVAILVVVRAGKTPRTRPRGACGPDARPQARVLGVVLNDVQGTEA